MDFWTNLLDTSGFPPRWKCGTWTEGHGWLHILSDLGVWSAYFAIPGILAFFVMQRRDLPFRRIFVLFVAFIMFCGMTHLMEAAIFWWPAYRLAGVIKFLTAAVSWTTVVGLLFVAPKALAMRSPEELEREISARRQAEKELQRTNSELEQRVEERTSELVLANRRKSEFMATLAHELRNPLAAIRNGVELMALTSDTSETIVEVRGTLDRQTVQLVRLVDDLLDMSRITRGMLELRKRRVPLAEVVDGAIEAARPLIDEREHELSVSVPADPVEVVADPIRLAQVISNLLHNAAKYTPPRGNIWLTVGCDGSEVTISVRDNGIGIRPEMRELIFEMFSQAPAGERQINTGLGIGLCLVKSLAELHGGSVEVTSAGPCSSGKRGQGSEFVVRLPGIARGGTAEAAHAAAPEVPASRRRQRVLVVDDNQSAARMLSVLIETLGNEVRTAEDGERAVEVAAEFRPDIVLMDLGMPRMNGYEAAERIRREPWGKGMKLVAVTGWGQDEDRQRTKAAGFDEHLVKPAELDEIRQVLAMA